MSSILVLLSPIWLSWKNDFLRQGRSWRRRWLLLGLALAFWCGTYFVIRRVLLYFQSVYDLGPSLAYQLLLIILLTFLSMLLFSNLITALSTFFLARDLDLVLSTPAPLGSFYYSRLITTTLNSSWMVLFFSLPIFVAYGTVFGAGFLYYLWVALLLPLFLIIPASVGVLVTHLLVYFLPAKRIRDILFFIGLFSFIIIYFLFRFSQPERLVQPESFGHFLQFLNAMETPASPFLPSSWSTEILAAPLFKKPTDQGFFYALLASYALFFPLVTSWIAGAVYLTGWSKAQESKQGRRQYPLFESALNWLMRPFPSVLGALMVKDIKAFLRDSTQWSQLFLLIALMVVYLYNFKVLPLDRSPLPTATLKTMVSFANLALAGFVLSAVAMRFAFPAVSLEGKAFWILQTAPISLRTLLWSKLWLNLSSAIDSRRTAGVFEQPAAAGAGVDDATFRGDRVFANDWDHRHLCRRRCSLSKIQLRPCGGNTDELRRRGLDDYLRCLYRRRCDDRSLADLCSRDARIEAGTIFGPGVMGYRAVVLGRANPDPGRRHRPDSTRTEKLGAAERLKNMFNVQSSRFNVGRSFSTAAGN